MKTRNQTKKEEETMIEEFNDKFFDASSKAWLENKVKSGYQYRYKKDAFQEIRRSKRLLEVEKRQKN